MNFGFGELVMIGAIVLIVFGAGKVPVIARELGQGIRDFKKALNNPGDELLKKPVPVKSKASLAAAKKKTTRSRSVK
jgi:sec-independent protein translocase protein TatA